MISVAMVPMFVVVPVMMPVIAMAVAKAKVVRMAEMKSEREMGRTDRPREGS
jgi:hypothetical protein